MAKKTIMTGRTTVLRAVEPEDLWVMYDIENDSDLWKHGRSNVPYSHYALRRFIEENKCDIYVDGQVRLTVTVCDKGRTIGFVDLQNFSPEHMRAEVGIAIVDSAQGCGYATDALETLVAYVRDVLRLHLLYAIVADDNTRAVKLFLRCGFVRTASLSQWLRRAEGFADASLFTLIVSDDNGGMDR